MWKTVTIGDICEFYRGLTYTKKDEVETDGFGVIRANNINLPSNKLVLKEIKYINKSVNIKPDKYIKKNDIIICTASGSKSHVGKVAHIEENLDMAFGGFMGALRIKAKEDCSSKFLYLVLISRLFKNYLLSLGDGSDINNLKFSQIENFKFQLPPLPEQQRIVVKLDAAFAEIDAAIETAEKKKIEVEKLFQRVLSNLISKKSKNDSSLTLKEIAKFLDYRGKTPPKTENGIKLLTAKNVRMGFIKNQPEEFVSEEGYKQHMTRGFPKVGDVIFTTEAPLGLVAQIEDDSVALGQRLITFQILNDVIKSIYLKFVLMSEPYQKIILERGTGATAKGIKASLLKEVKITFPVSVDEQMDRIAVIEEVEKYCNALANNYTKKVSSYQSLKSAILSQELKSEAA
tara:strand:+ start:308 stop:1513 length:1206 start_codon:yes stop_codon:yes gene_type:complete